MMKLATRMASSETQVPNRENGKGSKWKDLVFEIVFMMIQTVAITTCKATKLKLPTKDAIESPSRSLDVL